jgi:RNA polymerase sigma factor (sigma-70 family)
MTTFSPKAEWSDERLIKECLEGDEDAWRTLIDKYKNLIYSIPRKLGFSQSDASDIFQQICLQLVAALPSLREPKGLPAWIITTTSRACFQMSKNDRRFPSVDPESREGDIPSRGELPDRVLLELDRERMLREALSNLAPRCRELIGMLFFETPPVSYEEAARRLRLATGSIGFTRMRCLKSLRKRLDAGGFA